MVKAPQRIHELAAAAKGWLSTPEGDLLYGLARECRQGCIVEIGSYQGKSTTFLATGSQAGGGVRVYAVDPHVDPVTKQSRFAGFQRHIESAGLTGIVQPLVLQSADAAPLVADPVELLFIDGAHDLASVLEDWNLWTAKLIPGGYVALHDTLRFPGPREVADTMMLNSRDLLDFGLVDSITYGRKRRPGESAERTLRRLRAMTVKRIANLAVTVPMPIWVKERGSLALRWLQRG